MKNVLIALTLALAASAAVAAPTGPDEVARDMVQRLQDELSRGEGEFRREPAKLHRAVDAIVAPRFDIAHIARLVLARHWKGATPAQRERFQEAFKSMLIRSYATALLDLGSSGRIEWLPLTLPAGAAEATVRSRVVRARGAPLAVALDLRQQGGEWKVYDITVESVSLISSFRGQIGSRVRQHGIDAVIEQLERDTASTETARR